MKNKTKFYCIAKFNDLDSLKIWSQHMSVPSVRFPVQYTNQQLGMADFAQQAPTRNTRYTWRFGKCFKVNRQWTHSYCMAVAVDGSVDVFLESEAGEFAGWEFRLQEVLCCVNETLYFGGCVRKRVLTSTKKQAHGSEFWDKKLCTSAGRFVQKGYSTVLELSSRMRRIL